MTGFQSCPRCGKLVVAANLSDEPQTDSIAHLDFEVAEDEVVVPDSMQVGIGWRAWGVKPDPAPHEIPALYSLTHGEYFWPQRRAFEAECNMGKHEPGQIPVESCTCGLYSAKTLDHLQEMGYHEYDAESRGMFHVIGPVSVWGKVIEGSQGWRSQFAYPRELFVPFEAHHLAKRLSEAYGVPARLKNFLGHTFKKED